MTPLVYAHEVVFCLVLICYLLAALIGVVCFAMSISYKLKYYYVLPEVILSAVALILFCYFSEGIRIRYYGVNPEILQGSLCFMPTWGVIAIVAALLAFIIFLLVIVVKKRLSGLTAMSVKDAIAVLSCGLCFYDETGRMLLLNEQIDGECEEITGESLYDGIAFWDKICSGKVSEGVTVTSSEGSVIVERTEGKATCYKRILHDFGGKTVYEISGTDVSRELSLKKELESKNENLNKMNIRLRKYGEIVAEVTKERETLAARVKVHGNLGSLILRTKKSLTQGDYDRKTLISEWADIMSIIFASDGEDDKFAEADKTAASVGVRVFYVGKRPKKGVSCEKIFASAVFECVVNTARHADGDEVYVKMAETQTAYSVTLTNNGNRPNGEIAEGGGLSGLRTMTENAGGQMTVQSIPEFVLTITIPKEAANGR